MTQSTDLINEIDGFVQKAMQTWNIPGLALAVVKDDQILHAKGYGIRDIGKPELVDEHTLFAIASNTKAFTAVALGLLVQEGKLGWDDPVTRYLPYFQLSDPHASQLMTIRDLVCHRSGLGTWAGDVLLFSSYSAEEIIRRVRHIPPQYDFRAGFGYSNLMFIAAGLVISAVSGLSWEDFIRTRIFEPLGMTNSVANPGLFGDNKNVATPHEEIKGSLQTVGYQVDTAIGPAGMICSSAADIALWLRMQLNRGCLDGKQVVDAAIIAETHTPHTIIKLSDLERRLYPTRHFSAYGLGWFLSDFHGRFVARHTGGVDGMLSSVLLIPEEKIGLAVFTNKLPNDAFMAITNFLTEKLLGVPPSDWIQIYLDLAKEDQEKQAGQTKEALRVQDTRPSLALEKYAGKYESGMLGGAAIQMDGDVLRLQLQASKTMTGTLEHWHYDTFLCKWDHPVWGESLVPFISNGQGEITEFRVKIREDWIDPLEHRFVKCAAAEI